MMCFPERYRAVQAVDIILVPAAQRGFQVKGRATHGENIIVNPCGKTMIRSPRGTGFIMAMQDRTYQRKMRQRLPTRQHTVL